MYFSSVFALAMTTVALAHTGQVRLRPSYGRKFSLDQISANNTNTTTGFSNSTISSNSTTTATTISIPAITTTTITTSSVAATSTSTADPDLEALCEEEASSYADSCPQCLYTCEDSSAPDECYFSVYSQINYIQSMCEAENGYNCRDRAINEVCSDD